MRSRSGAVRRIVVFFGGADADNVTMKAIKALCLINNPKLKVDVVIGQENPHRETLQRECESQSKLQLHVQTERIAELFAAADLAIGAGGITTWERCALGLPALVIALAYNQIAIAEEVAALGAIIYLGVVQKVTVEMIRDELNMCLETPKRIRQLSECASGLVDTRGCPRVADILEEGR